MSQCRLLTSTASERSVSCSWGTGKRTSSRATVEVTGTVGSRLRHPQRRHQLRLYRTGFRRRGIVIGDQRNRHKNDMVCRDSEWRWPSHGVHAYTSWPTHAGLAPNSQGNFRLPWILRQHGQQHDVCTQRGQAQPEQYWRLAKAARKTSQWDLLACMHAACLSGTHGRILAHFYRDCKPALRWP